MASGGATFFERLEGLESKAEVRAAFDRYINFPIPLTSPEFFSRLYQETITHLLGWLGLPAGPGAELREWRSLFQLPDGIDPHYFTVEQIERCLANCPPMSAPQKETLLNALFGFFGLRREQFPSAFPSPLLSGQDVERWSALFPAELRWQSLAVLDAVGAYPVGSREGYRACKRFEEGEFEPDTGAAALPGWREHCKDGLSEQDGFSAKQTAAAGGDRQGPAHFRDFLAAAFAGRHAALGLKGFCGAVPRCAQCPLQKDCAWANKPAGESGAAAEVLGRMGQRRAAQLGNSQLLQGLLGLGEAEAKAVAKALGDTPLRRLAGKNAQEMEEWLEGSGAEAEAEKLLGLFELCRRYSEEALAPGVALVTAKSVFEHFRLRLRDFKQEQFLVVLLDTKRRFLREVMASQGTLNRTPVHPREVFNAAIRERAASVIVVHNHPAGDPTPSREDIQITHQLVAAGHTVGIPLLDHIIVAGEEYFSFVERGMM